MPNDGSLKQAIQQLDPEPMTEAQAKDAVRNLAGFFGLLIEIDCEQTAPRNQGRRE